MPRWICPDCSAAHIIPDAKVGQLVTCKQCGRDAMAEVANPLAIDVAPRRRTASNSIESVSGWARMVLIAIAGLLLLVGCTAYDKPYGPVCLVGGLIVVVQAVLVWPIYTACDDVRAIRRSIEQRPVS